MASNAEEQSPTGARGPSDISLHLSSPQITVIVRGGSVLDTRTFYIHESLVSQHSDFFAVALRNGWKEAEQRLVHLPEDTPDVFEVFARFMYSGEVFVYDNGNRRDIEGAYHRLVSCWALGEKLRSITFKDAMLDVIRKRILDEETFHESLYRVVYPISVPGSFMRRLCVDAAVSFCIPSDMEGTELDESYNAFYRDFAIKLLEEREHSEEGLCRGDCDYHEHVDEGSDCYLTTF